MPAHRPDQPALCRYCGHDPAREKYIVKMLLAAVKQAGGEIRLPAAEVDMLSETAVLAKDYDSKTQTVVLRLSSQFADFFVIRPDQGAISWANQTNKTSQHRLTETETANEQESHKRTVVVTDEMAAAIERRLVERAETRKREREATEAGRAVRTMSSKR